MDSGIKCRPLRAGQQSVQPRWFRLPAGPCPFSTRRVGSPPSPFAQNGSNIFQSTAPLAADFPHAGQQASVLLQALPLTQPSRASQRQWGPHASALTLLNASSSRAAGQHHGVDAALPAARLALRRLPHVRPEPQGAPLQAPACCPHTSRLPQQRKAATVAATTISNRPLHATA